MMIRALHLLLTYRCTYECDHCFVWGSPRQRGTMTGTDVREILRQAQDLSSVESIYFEGGEPFLYYPILVDAVQEAVSSGFRAGVVTNGYWATAVDDAVVWLQPMAGLIQDLSVSSDLYHGDAMLTQYARNAAAAAEQLGIPVGSISVAQPGERDEALASLMFRGRAAQTLALEAVQHSWQSFTACPYEDLRDPGRVHIDPLGNVHVCQGLCLGNLFRADLADVFAAYEPEAHPIVGPLLTGGPAELARRHRPPARKTYADACHLCYQTRLALRQSFPEILTPDQVYGRIEVNDADQPCRDVLAYGGR